MSVSNELERVTSARRIVSDFEATLVRDKTYQRFPIGKHAARWLQSLRWDHASSTAESYEHTVAHLAWHYPTLDITDLGHDHVLEYLQERWADSADGTKRNRVAALKSFFEWLVEHGHLETSPASRLRAPRRKATERQAYDHETVQRLIYAQDSHRDQVALQLLANMALRKNELRVLQIRHIDLARDLLTIHGKGGKVNLLPIAFKSLRDDLWLHVTGDARQADEYLLYPRNATERPMDSSSIHRWFKRCLSNADLPASIEMHELRHTAADHLWRATGNIVLAQQLLRHESVGTTQIYLHPSREDLAAGMRVLEATWETEAA